MAGRGTGRYRNDDNSDLLMRIKMLEERISKMERSPQLPNSAIDTGTLTVAGGEIDVLHADGVVAINISRLPVSGAAQMQFYPRTLDPDDSNIRFIGFANTSGYDGSAIPALQIYLQDVDSGDVYGGKILMDREGTIVSHQPEHIAQNEAFLYLGRRASDGAYASIYFQGTFNKNLFGTNQDALNVGSFVTGAGFSSFSWNYGVTYAATMYPVVTLLDAGANVAWVLQSFSNSGFTVSWATNTTTKTINFWAFRAA